MKFDPIMTLCTIVKVDGDRVDIKCKLGRWGVSGPNEDATYNEAKHYFGQYYRDGDYDEMIESYLK